MNIWKTRKLRFAVLVLVQFAIVSSELFAASGDKYNSWIDLPIIETIEYFTSLMAQALTWAWKYAALFGVIGIVWNAFKVQMNRMKPVQLFWDTTFKWVLFFALVTMYPSITYGFLGVATEIGEKAGMGKKLVEKDLKKLYDQATFNLKTADTLKNGNFTMETWNNIRNKQADNSTLSLHSEYESFMNSLAKKGVTDAPHFDSERDMNRGNKSAEKVEQGQSLKEFYMSGLTLYALKSVCTEKKLDGSDGDDLTDTYIQLQTYLVDKNGEDTMFISPAAMLRLSILCGLVMWDRWNYEYAVEKEENKVNSSNFFTASVKNLGHFFTKMPQMIEVIFCQLVLIIAIAFCMIQYVMTIIEFVIVTSIAAIFLPLMLFDGTKDIPKKFIPLMISHMMKITCMIICMYFVMYLLVEHTMNVIGETWGINLFAVAEIVFVAALCYVLTQNGPKVAQAIMTGQPQLSMGEALAGMGTAAATIAGMKQAPGAVESWRQRAGNKITDAKGTIAKHKAAGDAAVEALGENATAKQKAKARFNASRAVASEDLQERVRAREERLGQMSGSGFSFVDKAMQHVGLTSAGGGYGGGGGGAGGSSAYGQTGQWLEKENGYEKVQSMSNTSNANFRTATRYDNRTQSQRHMTEDEFYDEKKQQGKNITAKMIERENAKKAEKAGGGSDNPMPESMIDGDRPNG